MLILIIPTSFYLIKKENWKVLRLLSGIGLFCYISIPIQFSLQYRLAIFGSNGILSIGYFLLLIPILTQFWSIFPGTESDKKLSAGSSSGIHRINSFAFPLGKTALAVFIAISWTMAQPSIMKTPIQKLIEAAESGNTKDLPYYLEKTKSKHPKYGTEIALCEAIDVNCIPLVDWLLTQKPNLNVIPQKRGYMPLWYSIRAYGNLEITEKLLRAGANPNILLTEGSFGDTALGLALSMFRHRPLEKSQDFFKLLIKYGADLNSPVNAQGEFPAEVILCNDNAEIILSDFIKHGMDPLKSSGKNLFFSASLAKNPDQLRIMLSAGLTADAVDRNGNTFLHLMVLRHYNHDLGLSELQKKYAEEVINNQNLEGKTALHLAVQTNNPKTVKALLQYGADPTIKDKEGVSPEKMAEKERYLRVLKIIQESK
jgi:ankyrin repeat protein